MNSTSAWDPHLNRTVPVIHYSPNGTNSTVRYFNPYKFDAYNLVNLTAPVDATLLISPLNVCYFPLSGNYGMLNRILFLAEILFALAALALGYPPWLASIAVAAVLNYTTVAAIHLIVLRCVANNSFLDLDNFATANIVIVAIFFAYPLLQWSKTLRMEEYSNTRVIVACWAVLMSVTALVGEYRPTSLPEFPPVAEIFLDSFSFVDGAFFTFGPLYKDTVNPVVLDLSNAHYRRQNPVVGSCKPNLPEYASVLRKGQALVAAPSIAEYIYTNSYATLAKAFAVYAVITCATTITATLHGKHSTRYVRAKGYLIMAGKRPSTWRRFWAFSLALAYYTVHFVVGIFSLPAAIVIFVLDEMMFSYYPAQDTNAYIGQWGPWVGAFIIFVAAALNESTVITNIRDILVWAGSSLLSPMFPQHIHKRQRPQIKPKFTLFKKGKEGIGSLFHFFTDEMTSTSHWVRQPEMASKQCIEHDDSDDSVAKSPVAKSPVPKSLDDEDGFEFHNNFTPSYDNQTQPLQSKPAGTNRFHNGIRRDTVR